MFKVSSLILAVLLSASFSQAKVITDFATKTAGLQVWDVANGKTPVYFGAVLSGKNFDGKAIHACLALAFTKIDPAAQQVHYIHKMWSPSQTKNGPKCFYMASSDKSRWNVANSTVCTPDATRDKRPGTAGNRSREMTPDALTPLMYGQRIVDFDAGYAGQWTRCPYFSSSDSSVTQKEQQRAQLVLGGFNDAVANAAQAVQAGSSDPSHMQLNQIHGAFTKIHTAAMQKIQADLQKNPRGPKNYWGLAGLHAVGQKDGYFHMTTNGLGHGLVYKVRLDPIDTFGTKSDDANPRDDYVSGNALGTYY